MKKKTKNKIYEAILNSTHRQQHEHHTKCWCSVNCLKHRNHQGISICELCRCCRCWVVFHDTCACLLHFFSTRHSEFFYLRCLYVTLNVFVSFHLACSSTSVLATGTTVFYGTACTRTYAFDIYTLYTNTIESCIYVIEFAYIYHSFTSLTNTLNYVFFVFHSALWLKYM